MFTYTMVTCYKYKQKYRKHRILNILFYIILYLILIFKGTHTIYFTSSLYIIIQKPMIPRTHFPCITTLVARSSG